MTLRDAPRRRRRDAAAAARRARWAALGLAVVCTACGTPSPPAPPAAAWAGERFRHAPDSARRPSAAQAPAAPPTAQATAGPDATNAVDALDAATWRGFGDPALDSLIRQARSANLDVRTAEQRVRQARAGSAAARSRLLPTVALTGSASDQRSGLPAEVKRGAPDTRALRGALDLGWELDWSGAARAAAEAAERDALAADAGVEAARWLATTEVARQYLVWQGARLRLAQLQRLLAAQQATERLVRHREADGLASRFDLARAAGEVQSLAAQLPPLQTLVAVSDAQIKLLLGLAPGADLPALSPQQPAALPRVPALAPGQPIELLRRRPDLQAAEQQLLAEAARLRERQADQWPRLVLGAVLGQQDLRLNGLDLAPVRYSQIALAFSAPLFNAGRLRAAVERQSASAQAATLQYERAVLGALQDVENSLVALARAREQAAWLAEAVDSRRAGLRHAQALHREGQIDRLPLLDAERGLIAAELAETDGQLQRALAAVQLVKALGGGWHAEPAPAPTAP